MSRTCLDCPAPISPLSTGRCRKCANRARPAAVEARRMAAVMEAAGRPDVLEMKRRVARDVAAAKIAWCPPRYREHYRLLKKRKHLKAREARRMIEDQMRADTRGLDRLAAALRLAGLEAR